MGLTTRNISVNGLVTEENGAAFWQCRSRESTSNPKNWYCEGTYHGNIDDVGGRFFPASFTLRKVRPLDYDYEMCSVFFRRTPDELFRKR